MKPVVIYSADVTGRRNNCSYPHRHEVASAEELRQAVGHDYVCAEYADNYRDSEGFTRSTCLAMDCDNDHTDDPNKWVTPDNVAKIFKGVGFLVHYSQNHMKQKGGKTPRPKFHILFPINEIASAEEYTDLKKYVHCMFPAFDPRALDAARYFNGTVNPQCELYDGELTLDEFLEQDADVGEAEFEAMCEGTNKILEGGRNSTLSHFCGCVCKRLGPTAEAWDIFMRMADRCEPPLPDEELNAIWNSSRKFHRRVSAQEGYIPPDQYGARAGLWLNEDTDIAQARLVRDLNDGLIAYNDGMSYLAYDAGRWKKRSDVVRGKIHDATDLQKKEADDALTAAQLNLEALGAWEAIKNATKQAAYKLLAGDEAATREYEKYLDAKAFMQAVNSRRRGVNIAATLRELVPYIYVEEGNFNADPFLLCTPEGTIDLNTGEMRENRPDDYITHQTNASPSDEGMELWLDMLDTVFCYDDELIEYVQRVGGMILLGQIKQEKLIIAFGDGRNGKSTFWNVIKWALGDYSGQLSAGLMTNDYRGNAKAELAEIQGVRMVLMAELPEGKRLSSDVLKQIASADPILVEEKYKQPYTIMPSHTAVLYTNHLPKVSATDTGTWRRLVVIPFTATIEGNGEIPNYAEYLETNAGGAVLKWMIEGAKKFKADGYKLSTPRAVREATEKYRNGNDWLNAFLSECCDTTDPNARTQRGAIYAAYAEWARRMGEYQYRSNDFFNLLGEHGNFKAVTTKGKKFFVGIRLRDEEEDGLPF